MTRICLASICAVATVALGAPAAPAADRQAPPRAADCEFEGAEGYKRAGRIRVFTMRDRLYGCVTDVGRAYRLRTGARGAHTSAARRAVFGSGDWVGYPARDARGRTRVRATNLRSGRTHSAAAGGEVTALVVNFDGTLAWIAGPSVRAKPAAGGARTVGTDSAIDRRFLGLELEGCAVTWTAGGEQRSSGIYCSRP